MSKDGENENMNGKTIATIVGTIAGAAFSEGGRKFLCGTYSDGSPRSLSDALNGEIYSPKEREKKIKKYKKSKKKNKKKGKNSFDSRFRL